MTIRYTVTILILSIVLLPGSAFAEGGGLNINYNKINLRLEFNDNIKQDNVTGMAYIRNPSGLLFDLIYLIQANKASLKNIEQDIYIDADNLNQQLSIYLKKPPRGFMLETGKVKHFDKQILLSGICRSLKISDCVIPEDASTYFYGDTIQLSRENTDLIEFGCFPCDNNRIYTLTHRYTMHADNDHKPTCRKVTVKRHTINDYFKKLYP